MTKTTIIEIIKNIQNSEFKAFNLNADTVVYTIDTSLIPKVPTYVPIRLSNLKFEQATKILNDVQKSDLKAFNLNSNKVTYTIDTTSFEKTETENKNVNLFNILMNNVKAGYDSDNLNTSELYALATFIVLAELKNAIDPNRYRTTNKAGKSITKPNGTFPLLLYDLKNTVMEQLHRLTEVYNDGKTIDDYMTLNKKGDLVVDTAQLNKDMNKLYYSLYHGASNDAADLIQSTVLYLLEELEYMRANNIDSFETVRTERVPNKKIYIKVEDSANYWKDIDICGIQLIYKKLRSEINGQRAVKEAINNNSCYYRYEYYNDNLDSQDNKDKEVYIKVPKYSTLISANAYGLNTVSQCDHERLEELIDKLNLSNTQKAILDIKLNHETEHLGYKAIATKLGIRPDTVRTLLKRMGDKLNTLTHTDKQLETYFLKCVMRVRPIWLFEE